MQVASLPTNQVAGAIVLVVVGAAAKYLADAFTARRASRLKRLDAQLEQLYGPLLALSHAAAEAWVAFRSIHRPNRGGYWMVAGDPPSEAEAIAWRLWMTHVFMPLNERMESAVITNAHLLDELQMPAVLLTLCAHVEAYRGVLKQWETGDFSRHVSAVDYPEDLASYARRMYTTLKDRQAGLVRSGA